MSKETIMDFQKQLITQFPQLVIWWRESKTIQVWRFKGDRWCDLTGDLPNFHVKGLPLSNYKLNDLTFRLKPTNEDLFSFANREWFTSGTKVQVKLGGDWCVIEVNVENPIESKADGYTLHEFSLEKLKFRLVERKLTEQELDKLALSGNPIKVMVYGAEAIGDLNKYIDIYYVGNACIGNADVTADILFDSGYKGQ